jgi:hypothetical protein
VRVEFIVLVAVAVVVMVIILSGTYLTCQRVEDYCALEAKRAALIARVLNSRLGKMLRHLNISLRDYMRRFSDRSISHHVDTCQNCEASAACDAYLADHRNSSASARDFCPNMSEFDRLRDETPQLSAETTRA